MKKLFIISVCIFFNLYSFSQFKMISDGSPVMKGHVYWHAYEGDGNSGTAYLQARDFSNSSSISLRFRTQSYGGIVEAMHISPDGKIGVQVIEPQSDFEIADQKWMMFNAHDNSSGILFHETQGKTSNSVQYGGKIEYNENIDHFVFGTYQNWQANNAIYIRRGTGNVAIGGTASTAYEFQVHGNAYATGSWTSSDIRFKEDIKDFTDEPNGLEQLRGVSYVRKSLVEESDLKAIYDTIADVKAPVLPEREYGFIAQEVKEIFPNLVLEDEEGYLAINYNGFIPLLVEALKEQQSQITTLQQIVTEHEKEILALKGEKIESTELSLKKAEYSEDVSTNEESTTLYQNTPNPFSQETEIKFFIPQEINAAKIYIHDLNGGEIKVYELDERGISSLTIQASVLNKGMYTYTLVADGAIVDTKRMILTD